MSTLHVNEILKLATIRPKTYPETINGMIEYHKNRINALTEYANNGYMNTLDVMTNDILKCIKDSDYPTYHNYNNVNNFPTSSTTYEYNSEYPYTPLCVVIVSHKRELAKLEKEKADALKFGVSEKEPYQNFLKKNQCERTRLEMEEKFNKQAQLYKKQRDEEEKKIKLEREETKRRVEIRDKLADLVETYGIELMKDYTIADHVMMEHEYKLHSKYISQYQDLQDKHNKYVANFQNLSDRYNEQLVIFTQLSKVDRDDYLKQQERHEQTVKEIYARHEDAIAEYCEEYDEIETELDQIKKSINEKQEMINLLIAKNNEKKITIFRLNGKVNELTDALNKKESAPSDSIQKEVATFKVLLKEANYKINELKAENKVVRIELHKTYEDKIYEKEKSMQTYYINEVDLIEKKYRSIIEKYESIEHKYEQEKKTHEANMIAAGKYYQSLIDEIHNIYRERNNETNEIDVEIEDDTQKETDTKESINDLPQRGLALDPEKKQKVITSFINWARQQKPIDDEWDVISPKSKTNTEQHN